MNYLMRLLFEKPLRVFLLVELALFIFFTVSSYLVWRSVPAEGVKLHGNIDTGVDLLGARSDILWIAAAGTAVTLGNMVLALVLRNREWLASYFLLGTTVLLLLGFSGALWFISLLNAPQ
jgi:hypothetical protein